MVERKERGKKKKRSPRRQKASVVPKSMLICELADPWLEEACGKEKKMSRAILFTFAIWGPGLFFMQTLWFSLKVWISPLPPLTPTPLPTRVTFWPNGNQRSDGKESEQKLHRGICPHQSSSPRTSLCPAFVLQIICSSMPEHGLKSVRFNFKLSRLSPLTSSCHRSKGSQEQRGICTVKGRIYTVTLH